MTLSEQIQKDIVTAMKSKDEMRLSVLRMVKAALQLKEVEKLRPLDPAESIQLLQTLAKQRKESIDQFAKGGRQDLVDKEMAEIVVLETYLPQAASPEEIEQAVAAAMVETGATSMKEMGAVMKAVMAHLAGKNPDGRAVSESVKRKLTPAS